MARVPMQPLPDEVSVVIPTRNRAELLALTLRSVAEQTAPVARIIVADDGSTDSTGDVVRAAGATHVRKPTGGWGAAGARNAGLARVGTKYVTFVDSDDLLLPGAIEALVSALRDRRDAPFAFGRGLAAARLPDGWMPHGAIGPDRREAQALLASLYTRNSVPSSGALVRTEVARDIGGWDPAIRFVEDHDFWVRLARHGEPVHVPELVSVYRIHAGNRHTPMIARADAERIVSLAEGDPRLLPYVPDRLGVELCEVVIAAVKARRPGQAFAAASDLLLRRRGRARIVRRLILHFRARRSWGRQGGELWQARPELRDWLASY
jgi:glycosyltransferase involved in cell wall biosynthesis